ncbi:hypothetical protein [Alkalihalobacillus pseudalcaliphilus]|uniref:hypothetical protein n=1 Tax=Alkalihalobacillus pseudalcaliphilus TaxID=79884 RepID=UPI00064D89C3|nr:hypothetical protein [Alkalihalobacillus pseudalcaliphilus]KMK75412.1 hypothetical protein AB990_08830 [Alkalihalobacillus pseudalcaliphilus]
MKMKYIYLKTINWSERFESVKGSYYDYVATIYASSKEKEKEIIEELTLKGFREIKTNNGILVFEKHRHVVRLWRFY